MKLHISSLGAGLIILGAVILIFTAFVEQVNVSPSEEENRLQPRPTGSDKSINKTLSVETGFASFSVDNISSKDETRLASGLISLIFGTILLKMGKN